METISTNQRPLAAEDDRDAAVAALVEDLRRRGSTGEQIDDAVDAYLGGAS